MHYSRQFNPSPTERWIQDSPLGGGAHPPRAQSYYLPKWGGVGVPLICQDSLAKTHDMITLNILYDNIQHFYWSETKISTFL